ncbi:PadR family transcriptional regulator [Nocardioides sp.]|uniref:PadR family transcriptional regulator n=1 Tax=Nocardioides sp. TaxID=35761 RepID=UPI00286A4927|nr:PadR family transcriptional regulator [Nocardioides sp.]
MGHPGRNKQWARGPENPWQQHRGGRSGGNGWDMTGWGRPGHGGPPPWMAGLFGMGRPDERRGPRVRRGDVRSAILDVLREAALKEEPVNGYQVIQQIAEKSKDAWRPSPGSVYPTIQQLEDEGLVETDEGRGRRALRLTAEGATYVAEHTDELAGVWAPFERREKAAEESGPGDLKPEIGQLMGAVWQIVTSGSEQQRTAAIEVLVDTRRKLYGILADGAATDGSDEEDTSAER